MKEALLKLKNIYKSFDDQEIHRGLNLGIYQGESVALLGGSGTGKSVLLRSIIGLEKIDQGEIIFEKTNLAELKEKELLPYRLKISYSFQSGALFDSLNVFQNISYPLVEHTKLSDSEIALKVKNILKLIDLEGVENLMPSDLSGGMQKRVGMARSLILEPQMILYDEPTAGLDPQNTKNIISLMIKLKNEGLTSIFVTHDIPSALELCDRIAILKDGKIGYLGTPREFIETKDITAMKYKLLADFHT